MLDLEICLTIDKEDPDIAYLIQSEIQRQNEGIELIASENYPSTAVKAACGSELTCKYAEGYPGKRYYGGCEYIDKIEQLAIDRACKLFNCKYANVQPHSGSQANAIAYRALERFLQERNRFTEEIETTEGFESTCREMRILSMDLNSGAHLSHGSPVSFSSYFYNFDYFALGDEGKIDFNKVEEKIQLFKPDVILTGYSAYPYEIDFKKFKELANKYDCLLMVDMAHIAGLVAAGLTMNPCEYADIVTSTTHKTLRGPRGGLILTNNEELAKYVNSATFPFYQGGPLENIIAGKAICFNEAMQPDFKNYIKQVLLNTKAFTNELKKLGCDCSDTENHLMLLNTKKSFGLTGIEAQKALEAIKITTNKNMLPADDEKPSTTSGLRIGFAALTTRGCTEDMAVEIADIIYYYLKQKINILEAKKKVNCIIEKLNFIQNI